MAGGDVPRGGPSGKNKKKLERALAGRRPARAFELKSANVGGGIEVRGGPGTVRGGPGTARGGPDTVRGGPSRHATYATYNHADSGF